jgi:hypothetical protein
LFKFPDGREEILMAQAVALRAWKRKAFAHDCLIVDS